MERNEAPIARSKALIFAFSLLPFAWLIWAGLNDQLGANPVETVQRWTGTWTLNFLLLTLCISPLRSMTGLHWLMRLRRTLGLFSFFYAALHVLSFIGFDHAFAVDAIARDILKRPFVTLGAAAFVLMIPLALTSNAWAIRHLGGRRWQELHRSIYLIAILGCLHYFWLAKLTQILWPLTYALALALLLAWRIRERRRKAIPVPQFGTAKPLKFFKQRPE